jgi:hypothetical protein
MKPALAIAVFLFAACASDDDVYNLDTEPMPEEVEADDDPVLAAELEALVDTNVEHGRCSTLHVEPPPAAPLDPSLEAELDAEDAGRATTITIGVAFHVIRARIDGKLRGDISGERIRRQIRVLNDAFSSTRFRFELRAVSRTTNDNWFRMNQNSAAERAAKRALHRGGARLLNIYSTGTRDALGWATFPWDDAGSNMDGVVIQFGTTPNGSRGRFTLGDTAVHEVGHWLGLFHTFGLLSNGCESGDAVADTNEERTPAFGCPRGRNTCPEAGDDPIHNFMDYTDDACMNRFSRGQRRRMVGAWKEHRD